MIEIQEIKTANIQEIMDMLLEQSFQSFEVYAPKSTQLAFSEQLAIADDYALLAYVGQRLKDVSDEFSYTYIPPDKRESVLFNIKTNKIEKLAKTLLELSYNFNNDLVSDEYIPFEKVYDFIDKVQTLEIIPACPDFIDIFREFVDESEKESN
jgi:hypothetical protein